MEVLTTATVPGQWEAAGGDGRIVAYPKTLSLIVRQTNEGHKVIQELLEQLRAENKFRIQVRIGYLEARTQNATATAAHQPA